MLIHLLYYLGRKKKKPQGRSAAEEHRHTEMEPVVVECPYCGTIGVCRHEMIEESPGTIPRQWRPVNAIYHCAKCHEVMESVSFQNDGSGVLRAKQWTCKNCQTINHDMRFTCTKCHEMRGT